MKNIIIKIVLIILIITVGILVVVNNKKQSTKVAPGLQVQETKQAAKVDTEKEETEKLQKQIVKKNYTETAFSALEYTKISVVEINKSISEFNALQEDQKEDGLEGLKSLISINEDNFYNRYSAVFSEFPSDSDNMKEIDTSVKEILYQIKEGYIELDKVTSKDNMTSLQSGSKYFDDALNKINSTLKVVANKDIEIEGIWMNLPDNTSGTQTNKTNFTIDGVND